MTKAKALSNPVTKGLRSVLAPEEGLEPPIPLSAELTATRHKKEKPAENGGLNCLPGKDRPAELRI